MLTMNDVKWLRERRTKIAPCGACWNWCRVSCGQFGKGSHCLLDSDYRYAAEFEARVAVIAANGMQPCLVDEETPALGGYCPEGKENECVRYNPCFVHCGLKHARLYVEEKMDQ